MSDKLQSLKDLNECARGIDECSEDATCTNTKGSYECTCNQGLVQNLPIDFYNTKNLMLCWFLSSVY